MFVKVFCVVFLALVCADRQPVEVAPRILSGKSNLTYGYPTQSTTIGYAERRPDERTQRRFPEKQPISNVQYASDSRGIHSIDRQSTKNNRSPVEKLNEQNDKVLENPVKTKEFESDQSKDTIIQVLESLFPDGIPSKYSILVNSTEGLNFKENSEDTFTTTQRTKNIHTKEALESQTHEVYDRKRLNFQNTSKEKIPFNNFDSSRLSSNSKRKFQSLVSDKEVLQINDAAENYKDERTKQFREPLSTPNTDTEVGSIGQYNSDELYPFESPIVVQEMQNDNLVLSNRENRANYVVPTKEINIMPSREEFLNTEEIQPDGQINVKIIQPDLNEVAIFKTGLLTASTAHDLDTFQRIVEESFSRSEDYNTEAPSRAFLREFDQRTPTLTNSQEENENNEYDPIEVDRLGSTTEEVDEGQQSEITPPRLSNNEHFVEGTTTTLNPSARPRGKTFVEIQKAVNIQNLLIKEDADSIERHEEYLQPLADGQRLTHRIESKFMKEKPWESTKKQTNYRERMTNPLPLKPSSSYSNNKRNQKSLEYNSNTKENNEKDPLGQDRSLSYFNADSDDKAVEESVISKLHTKVDYSTATRNFPSNEFSGIKHSKPTSIITKVVPYPVEKIVEKEVKIPVPIKQYVEKFVDRPVEVEKIVDRPVPVPYLVPFERIVELPIHVPYPVHQIVEVEKLVETRVPVEVEKVIDRPVPVHVEKIVHRPYPVEKIVEKVVNRPVTVHVPVKVPVRVPVPIQVPVHVPVPSGYFYSVSQSSTPNPNSHPGNIHPATNSNSNNQNVQNNFLNLEYQQIPLESVYSAVYSVQQNFPEDISKLMKQKELCKNKQLLQSRYGKQIDQNSLEVLNQLKDAYFGPVPMENEYSHWGGQHFKRNSDFGRNLRMEYGFKPPLIPSIEIDDQGLPISKNKNS